MFEKCNFEIMESSKDTWDDNGAVNCLICKYWHDCREKDVLEDMKRFENEVLKNDIKK